MVIIGIIADTHISSENEKEEVKYLLEEIKRIFKDVDEIIHAGDVCEGSFLEELNKIAPTRCVKGNMDYLELEVFIRFSVGSYNIGVIHTPPDHFEEFFNKKNINILIHGHTHQPIIK